MKHIFWLITMMVLGTRALSAQAVEVDQLKADLIGQSMGGRERCWKFQSIEQIKELAIQEKTENPQKRVYTIALQLQAAKTSGKYGAKARVEYVKTATGWKVKHVGLLSLTKTE